MTGSSFRGRNGSHFKDKDSSVDGASMISQDDAIFVSYKKDPDASDTSLPLSSSTNYIQKGNKARSISNEKHGSTKDFTKSTSKFKHNKGFADGVNTQDN